MFRLIYTHNTRLDLASDPHESSLNFIDSMPRFTGAHPPPTHRPRRWADRVSRSSATAVPEARRRRELSDERCVCDVHSSA